MEVVVTEVSTDDAQVRATVGDQSWRGEWRGTAPPKPGLVDVEVDVLGELRWTAPRTLTGTTDGGNVVVGHVEDSDADGTVTLRVGSGIVLVGMPDDGPLPRLGETLRLERVGLSFFPTGI